MCTKEVSVMELLHLGENIIRLRKKEHMTQEDLAEYMGVSKSSVSKWETAATYPDIMFLPELANLFNVTLDELIGYEPQLNKQQIRKIYHTLSDEMSKGDKMAAMEKLNEYLHRYASCFPFLNQMCVLLLNHVYLYENKQEIYEQILTLCKRIKEKSDDTSLIKEAQIMASMVHLQLQQPEEVLNILGESSKTIQMDNELIAMAYQMMNQSKKASEILQVTTFQYLLFFVQDSLNYMVYHMQEKEVCDQVIKRIGGIVQLFEIDQLHPFTAIGYYLSTANVYALRQDKESVFTQLEHILHVVELHPEGFHKLKGDGFFNQIDAWLEELDLGPNAPLNEHSIKDTLIQSLEMNPSFAFIHDEFRYKNMIEKLKSKLMEEN